MRLSVSQLVKAETCLRAWAFGSVHKIWEPSKQATEDGDTVHGHCQNHVKYGFKLDPTDPMQALASLALPYLPTRADDPLIEEENSSIVTYAGHEYVTKSDFMWLGPTDPQVADLKTCKTFRYALNAPALRADPQSAVYALAAMNRYDTTTCDNTWIYLRHADKERGEPAAHRVVNVMMEKEDALAVLRSKHPKVEQMADVAKRKLPILEVPGNSSKCGNMYGKPCFYRPRCYPGMFTEDNQPVQE